MLNYSKDVNALFGELVNVYPVNKPFEYVRRLTVEIVSMKPLVHASRVCARLVAIYCLVVLLPLQRKTIPRTLTQSSDGIESRKTAARA